MESVKIGDDVRVVIQGFFFKKVGKVMQLRAGKFAGDLLVAVKFGNPERTVFFRHDEIEKVRNGG